MKTNSRFSRNIYAISDRIWCNKHLRHTSTEKYDNNGKDGYFRFDDDNNMSYRYVIHTNVIKAYLFENSAVCLTTCSNWQQKKTKHQSSALVAFFALYIPVTGGFPSKMFRACLKILAILHSYDHQRRTPPGRLCRSDPVIHIVTSRLLLWPHGKREAPSGNPERLGRPGIQPRL